MSFFFNGTEGINLSARYGTGPLNLLIRYPFTLSCWFYPTDLTAGVPRDIIHIEDSTTSNNYYIDHNGTSIRVNTWNGTSGTSQASSTALVVNKWHHVMARFRSNLTRVINVNGSSGNLSSTNSGQTSQVINGLYLGQSDIKTRFFQGFIAHVAIYSSELQTPDGSLLWGGASPLTLRQSSLIAYFPMCRPGEQRNIAHPKSTAFKPLANTSSGARFSNWDPPVREMRLARERRIFLLAGPGPSNRLRSQISFLKPYTGILPIPDG